MNISSEKYQKFEELRTEFRNYTFPYIAAKNVIRDFEIGDYIVRAVDNVSIEIGEHEYVALTGVSGSGKTTLLNLLGGLDKPSSGQVILSKIDITPMEPESLAIFRIFNTGFIFQNYNLISSFSAIENVMFPLQLSGTPFLKCVEKAEELLKMIGLEDRAEHLPFQLSAGEQQRVAIARALANDPPIIIADEPTANLDVKNADYIGKLFERLRHDGKTVVIATHDANLINYAHRVIEMVDGKIIKDTKVQDISFKEPEPNKQSPSDNSEENSDTDLSRPQEKNKKMS